MTSWFGKYRGTVINNIDPIQIGRLMVSCPVVLGVNITAWAMPCVPYAGPGVGMFFLPPIGADLWLEFEGGDPSMPIWVGGFWTVGLAPALPGLPTTKIIKTDGCTIKLDDLPGAGGITIEVMPPVVAVPASIKLSANGIEITTGAASVALDPVMVKINKNALEVM